MSVSSSSTSEDETPRPADTIDHDFFDSDTGDKGEVKHSSINMKSNGLKYDSDDDAQGDGLHGSGRQRQKKSFGKSDERKTNFQQDRYTSSTKIEMKRVYRTSSSPDNPKNREKLTVHIPHNATFTKDGSDRDSDSSDSVTDVSPLSSPDATPRPGDVKVKGKRESGDFEKSTGKREKRYDSNSPVPEMKRPLGRRPNGEALSIEDLFYSSESSHKSSDERDIESQKKKRVHRKRRTRYDEVQQRTEASAQQHRRRLLNAAAENSMDLSQLLEAVLDMERENEARRSLPVDRGSRNGYPPPLKPSRKKNMSFTNERVRNIDEENQRLLKRLAQLNTRTQRPSSASSIRSMASSCRSSASTSRNSRRPFTASSTRISPNRGPRMYHSAINRLRDQRRIEQENLALLRRLQMTKSSSSLRKENLLRDYERQTGRVVPPAPRPSTRRRQRLDYSHSSDYDHDSIRKAPHKPRPVWQDTW